MLTYALNRAARTSLYDQLYRALRSDIESGVLAADARLPSKRAFAKHLGVSVVTVEGAYDQLVAEGYARAVPRSGFYVQEIGPNAAVALRSSALGNARSSCESALGAPNASEGILSNGAGGDCGDFAENGGSTRAASRSWLADFTGATAPEGVFPYAAWARTLRRVLAEESERTVLEAAGPQGSPRLRAAIAAHLRGFRGMEVRPEQIVIGSGAQSLYSLLVQLLGRDLVYGVEDPGYPRLVRIYESNDVTVRPVALDGEGPALGALERAGVDVLHCTPSHQFPLGITVPVNRRRALLEWAQDAASTLEGGKVGRGVRSPVDTPPGRFRYLIEDDFDCEFRMAGRPVPPLAALDGAGRVIYANTFSKTLGAAFRIGYVVLPEALAARFRDRLGFYACTVGALEQLTLARFMESGDYERHVNRQRTRYRRLLGMLTEGLATSPAGSHLRFANGGAGLHFLMEVEGVEGGASECMAFEESVTQRVADGGVRLAPLSRYRFTSRETGVLGRSSSEAVGCRGEALEAEGARKECDEMRSGRSEGRAQRRPAFVMSFSSLKEETIPEVAGIVSDAVMAELGERA